VAEQPQREQRVDPRRLDAAQDPSASCRSRIQRSALRTAYHRSGLNGCRPYACSALSSAPNASSHAVARAVRGRAAVPSSAIPNGTGRTGRRLETTASGTIVWRAQQAQS